MALFPDFFLITFYPIFLQLNHIYLTRILHIVLIETNISSKMLDMNNKQSKSNAKNILVVQDGNTSKWLKKTS